MYNNYNKFQKGVINIMFSNKSVTTYCNVFIKNFSNFKKTINTCDKLLKSNVSIKDNEVKNEVTENGYDALKNLKKYQNSPWAKKILKTYSPLEETEFKDLESLNALAKKIANIKKIYEAQQIKGTGLREFKAICNSSQILKDKIEFSYSSEAEAISTDVSEFLKLLSETQKLTKGISARTKKNSIEEVVKYCDKNYVSLKSNIQATTKNMEPFKESCDKLKDKYVEVIGNLSKKEKTFKKIQANTSSADVQNDVNDYSNKIKEMSENVAKIENIFNTQKIDKSMFDCIKTYRNYQKTLLSTDAQVDISRNDANRRIQSLNNRWNIFNQNIIQNDYENAKALIGKNIVGITRLKNSIKEKNNSTNKTVDSNAILKKVRELEIFKSKTDITSLFKANNDIDQNENTLTKINSSNSAEGNIKEIEETARSQFKEENCTLFELLAISKMYVEISSLLIQMNDFLIKCTQEFENNLTALQNINSENDKKKNNILNSKAVNALTKLSAIGCFTGVMLSIGYPFLAPIVAAMMLTAIGLQIAQTISN